MKYVNSFTDNRGVLRYYFRRRGKRFPLPEPESPGFDVEYERFLAISNGVSEKSIAEKNFGFVYVVRLNNSVKIGFSQNFKKRLSGLQCGCPYPLSVVLVIPGWEREEKALHKRFRRHRIANEWFTLSPEIEEWIEGERSRSVEWQA